MATVTRQQLEEHIINKALESKDYRASFLANPKAALERTMGEKLPESLQVKVVQESPSTVYIRLPHIVEEGAELADADLELVAGGKGGGGDTVNCVGTAQAGGFQSKNEFHLMG